MTASNNVFISYRRTASAYLALAIYQELSTHNIDVFYDMEGIASGQFGTIILNQIAARPYFMPILTPGTLENCVEANDWVLREMRQAMQCGRVFVPIHTPEFKFADIDSYLPPDLAAYLRSYNMMELPLRFFKYAMQDMRDRFLKPITLEVTPTPTADVEIVAEKQQELASQSPVTERQLTAEEHFIRGLEQQNQNELDAAMAHYMEALRLDPQYALAYNNRGMVRSLKGDKDGAMADYTEAIRLDPGFALPYNNRAKVKHFKGDLSSAIADYNEAIRLDSNYVDAYYSRGLARHNLGNLSGAIADYSAAIRLNPNYAVAYTNRGLARDTLGDYQGAAGDYRKVLELKPDHPQAADLRDYIKHWGK